MSSLVLVGGRKKRIKKVVRRPKMAGAGLFGDGGAWLGRQAGDKLGSLFGLGRRKKTVKKSGGMKRRRGGFSIPEWLKPTLKAAKEAFAEKAAQYVGEKVDPAAGRYLQRGIYHLGNKYGFGRKKRGGRVSSGLML
jgi:hypothetical protein